MALDDRYVGGAKEGGEAKGWRRPSMQGKECESSEGREKREGWDVVEGR
jgi:hypothetical protein